MKVLSIAIFRVEGKDRDAVLLCEALELSSFGFFEKRSVREMLTFFSKTVVQRVAPGQRVTVDQDQMKEYQVHVHVRSDGLGATMTADAEYPTRGAYSALAEIMNDFAANVPEWQVVPAVDYPPLQEAIFKVQDPANYDKITKIQKDLDDTQVILHQTVDNLLERGEKLDNLVERSDDLSKQSKIFYKQARKTNSCCVVS
mmetsp:Transcript_33821/g.108111  ORF Transcript_33821/g.108111 Transcript_33821/m.108111 type:complete len:200 (+) Transcript_33821:134-733(+)